MQSCEQKKPLQLVKEIQVLHSFLNIIKCEKSINYICNKKCYKLYLISTDDLVHSKTVGRQRSVVEQLGLPVQRGGLQHGACRGMCFLPDTMAHHASLAMNLYYQSRGANTWNCDFSSTALTALTDPSIKYMPSYLFYFC